VIGHSWGGVVTLGDVSGLHPKRPAAFPSKSIGVRAPRVQRPPGGGHAMGGYGSGSWHRPGVRRTTDHCLQLYVRVRARHGVLAPGHHQIFWSRGRREWRIGVWGGRTRSCSNTSQGRPEGGGWCRSVCRSPAPAAISAGHGRGCCAPDAAGGSPSCLVMAAGSDGRLTLERWRRGRHAGDKKRRQTRSAGTDGAWRKGLASPRSRLRCA